MTTDVEQADVIRQLIIDKGLGVDSLTDPWSVFTTSEPDTPDDCITVYGPPGRTLGKDIVGVDEYPGVQVRVRAQTYDTGRAKIIAIQKMLDAASYSKVTVASARYTVESVIREGPMIPLGRMQGGERRLFTLNCLPVINKLGA